MATLSHGRFQFHLGRLRQLERDLYTLRRRTCSLENQVLDDENRLLANIRHRLDVLNNTLIQEASMGSNGDGALNVTEMLLVSQMDVVFDQYLRNTCLLKKEYDGRITLFMRF